MKLVSIIIVNYNGRNFLVECIKSVLRQGYHNFEIIVVDNGSTDNSLITLENELNDSKIKIVKSEKNLGFAGGNNLGLKYSEGDYIALLNNDTIVEENWLEYLVDTLENNKNAGIVQSLVLTEGIPLKFYEKNGTINLLGHNIMSVFEINNDGCGEILQATGCSLIIRKETIDKLNCLFLNEYFAYAEDTFLSLRVKFLGCKLMHCSRSIVHHKGNITTNMLDKSLILFYQERNRMLNFLLLFSRSFIVKYVPYIIINLKLKFIVYMFRKKYDSLTVLKSYFWLIKNKKWITEQRKIMNEKKIIPENEVLKFISCKLFNGNNLFERFVNFISLLYCKLTGIKTIETTKK